MLSRSIRVALPIAVRLVRQQPVRRTLFTPSAIRSADLVQEMYLRELKNYKPSPAKASDAEGHVQKFSMPKPPAAPEETDLAKDLKTYENQQPEIEGQSTPGESTHEEDWFEEPEEEDTAGRAAH